MSRKAPQDDKILTLIGQIYELGLNAETWPQMLEKIAAQFGCNKASYTYFAPRDASRSHDVLWHPEPDAPAVIDARNVFRQMPAYSDIWMRSFVNGRHFGEKVIRGHTIVDRSEFLASDWFHQVINPLGTYDILAMPVSYADGAWGFCNVFSSERQGVFSQTDVALYTVLRPHIARVIDLQRRLGHTLRLGALACSALDALSFPLFLVEASGKIAFANKQAQSYLRSGDIVCDLSGRLTTADPNARLRQKYLLERACGIGGRPIGGTVPVRRDGAGPRALHIFPFDAAGRPSTLSPLAVNRVALVIVTGPEECATPNLAIWTALFGLTTTEAAIAEQMLQGRRQIEIAGMLGISENTVRWHVKSMLRKTDTSREAELVMRLSRAIPPVDDGTSEVT